METRGEVSKEVSEEPTGRKIYKVEGNNVQATWRIFEPREVLNLQEASNSNKAVVFLPGWSITQEAKSGKMLYQAFADNSQSPTFVVDTRVEKIAPGFLAKNAEAVRQFIQEKGLKDLTIVGNSLGGAEAIHLTVLLQQQNPDINIDGLVLLDSMSLYNQNWPGIAVNWARDLASTLDDLRKPPKFKGDDGLVRQNIKYVLDGIEILKEVMRSRLVGWPKRQIYELRAMAKTSPHLAEIEVPIVLIQGAQDLLSKPSEIIPKSQSQDSVKDYIEDTKVQEREQFLKKNIFINSPYVRMIVPEKMGHHNVSYSRPESVASVSLYFLKRWHRQKA